MYLKNFYDALKNDGVEMLCDFKDIDLNDYAFTKIEYLRLKKWIYENNGPDCNATNYLKSIPENTFELIYKIFETLHIEKYYDLIMKSDDVVVSDHISSKDNIRMNEKDANMLEDEESKDGNLNITTTTHVNIAFLYELNYINPKQFGFNTVEIFRFNNFKNSGGLKIKSELEIDNHIVSRSIESILKKHRLDKYLEHFHQLCIYFENELKFVKDNNDKYPSALNKVESKRIQRMYDEISSKSNDNNNYNNSNNNKNRNSNKIIPAIQTEKEERVKNLKEESAAKQKLKLEEEEKQEKVKQEKEAARLRKKQEELAIAVQKKREKEEAKQRVKEAKEEAAARLKKEQETKKLALRKKQEQKAQEEAEQKAADIAKKMEEERIKKIKAVELATKKELQNRQEEEATKKIGDEAASDNDNTDQNVMKSGMLVIGVYDFIPENDDELEFKKDDVLEVIEIIEEPAGWLMAKHQKNGKSGMIPDTYVKKMKTTSKLIPVKESKKSCIVM